VYLTQAIYSFVPKKYKLERRFPIGDIKSISLSRYARVCVCVCVCVCRCVRVCVSVYATLLSLIIVTMLIAHMHAQRQPQTALSAASSRNGKC